MDELAQEGAVVHLLHSVWWVALNTVEYVAWHELTGGVITLPLWGTMHTMSAAALTVSMWMVCL